jgi:hypothetical protein
MPPLWYCTWLLNRNERRSWVNRPPSTRRSDAGQVVFALPERGIGVCHLRIAGKLPAGQTIARARTVKPVDVEQKRVILVLVEAFVQVIDTRHPDCSFPWSG